MRTRVSLPRPVDAREAELLPLPVSPVDEGLLTEGLMTTAATGADVEVVVLDGIVVVVDVEVVEVVVEVVVVVDVVVVVVLVVVATSGVTSQQGDEVSGGSSAVAASAASAPLLVSY
jgi:hypothetical protein